VAAIAVAVVALPPSPVAIDEAKRRRDAGGRAGQLVEANLPPLARRVNRAAVASVATSSSGAC
jgi:hypothetical protein